MVCIQPIYMYFDTVPYVCDSISISYHNHGEAFSIKSERERKILMETAQLLIIIVQPIFMVWNLMSSLEEDHGHERENFNQKAWAVWRGS